MKNKNNDSELMFEAYTDSQSDVGHQHNDWDDARLEDMVEQLRRHAGKIPEEVMLNIKATIADALEKAGEDYVLSRSSNDY